MSHAKSIPVVDTAPQIIGVAAAALDRAVARQERIEAKAQGQVTLAGSWFALALSVCALSMEHGTPLVPVVAFAVLLVVGAYSFYRLLRVQAEIGELREQPEVGSRTLKEMWTERAEPSSSSNLLTWHRYQLWHKHRSNDERAMKFISTKRPWEVSILCSCLLFGVAVAAQISGG